MIVNSSLISLWSSIFNTTIIYIMPLIFREVFPRRYFLYRSVNPSQLFIYLLQPSLTIDLLWCDKIGLIRPHGMGYHPPTHYGCGLNENSFYHYGRQFTHYLIMIFLKTLPSNCVDMKIAPAPIVSHLLSCACGVLAFFGVERVETTLGLP